MKRSLRIEFSGALYHVTSRGDWREDIDLDDDDRLNFAGAGDRLQALQLGGACLLPDEQSLPSGGGNTGW